MSKNDREIDVKFEDQSNIMWLSNNFAKAILKGNLSFKYYGIFNLALYKVVDQLQKKDNSMKVKISLQDYFQTFNLNKKNIQNFYKEGDDIATKLSTYQYYINLENKRKYGYFNIFKSVTYEKGVLIFQFIDEYKKFFRTYNKHKTYLILQYLIDYRNPYFFELYRLLKGYGFENGLRVVTIKIEELKKVWNINPKKYKRWADFKKWVFEPTIEVFNKIKDYHWYLKFEYVKDDKKIVAIKFTYHHKDEDFKNEGYHAIKTLKELENKDN